MRAALILILALSTISALPGTAAAWSFGRTFGLTRAHAAPGSAPKAFKPFHGKHLNSRRGGLDAYPHPRRSKVRFG
jgi:hypothetical protein